MEDPVVLLADKSVRSSFGRTIMGKAIRESSIEVRLGEGFQFGNAYSLIKWTIEKLMLDNARKLRSIYFIDPED